MADKGLVVFVEGTISKRDTGDWWQKEPLELEETEGMEAGSQREDIGKHRRSQ